MAEGTHVLLFMKTERTHCVCGNVSEDMVRWVGLRGKTRDYFCEKCFEARLLREMNNHIVECLCEFKCQPMHYHIIPTWMNKYNHIGREDFHADG